MKETHKRAFTIVVATLLATSMVIPVIGLMPGIEKSHQGVASATEHDNYVYSGGDDNYLRAWQDNNTQEYSAGEGNSVLDVKTDTSGDYIYNGDSGGDVRRRHAQNGSAIWGVAYSGGVGRNGLSVDPNTDDVYAGFSSGLVVRLDRSDGTEKWRNNLGDNVYATTVGPNGDYVYAFRFDNDVYKLHASNGTIEWSTAVGGNYAYGLNAGPDGNYVYVGNLDGNVYKLDSADGSQAASASVATYFYDMDIDDGGNYLYIGDNGANVYKVDTSDLSTVWTQSVPDGNARAIGYDISSSKLYASSGSNIYEIDTTNTDSPRLAFNDHTNDVRAIAGSYEFTTASEVSGTVTDAQNGTAVDNATIDIYQAGSLLKSTTTDSNGDYGVSLEDGDYTFETSKNGYETSRKNVTVSGATTVDIQLDGIYDINGFVKENTKEGSPIADANIKVFQNGTQEYSAVANDSGYYKITGIVGGNYTFNVSALGYEDISSEKYVDSTKQINFRLNNKEDEYVPYMEFKTPAWVPSNDSRSYHVYFSDENGDYKEVTKDANVTSLNVSRIKVNTSSLKLEGQPGINATVNVTAEYVYKGNTYEQTNEVVLAKLEVAQVEILPPSHRISAFLRDSNVQMIIVAIIIGTTAAYLTANPFVGLGGIQLVLMIAWANNRLNTGILLVGFYYMLFAGLISKQVRRDRH